MPLRAETVNRKQVRSRPLGQCRHRSALVDTPEVDLYNLGPQMIFLLAWCAHLPPAFAPAQSVDEAREALKHPAQVFPLFQKLTLAGRYADAWNWTLSPKTHVSLPYEAFYLSMTGPEMSFDVSRRLLASLRVSSVDEAARVVRVSSPEFGIRRELRLTRFANLWVLDFSRDELRSLLSYFADRALAWYRLQVKRADGWHYAYPPDWTYAPLARASVGER